MLIKHISEENAPIFLINNDTLCELKTASVAGEDRIIKNIRDAVRQYAEKIIVDCRGIQIEKSTTNQIVKRFAGNYKRVDLLPQVDIVFLTNIGTFEYKKEEM